MRDMAGVPFAAERIFSQTVSGRPKGEVMLLIMMMMYFMPRLVGPYGPEGSRTTAQSEVIGM